MRKMIRVNEKRLTAKYNRRIFLAALPAVSMAVSLLVVVLLFVTGLDKELPQEMYRTIFYVAYAACAYGFVVCLIGSAAAEILIRAHREHTYIHISGSVMVVSQHTRAVYQDGRWVHYKKMWVIKLADVTNVECIRNHLTINAEARYFNEDARWLGYSETEDGISFDRWWYDVNGGRTVGTVEVTDFYTYGDRIARHIDHCANKIRERNLRRERFRQEMMEIAKGVKHPKRIRDKYKPKRKRYR